MAKVTIYEGGKKRVAEKPAPTEKPVKVKKVDKSQK